MAPFRRHHVDADQPHPSYPAAAVTKRVDLEYLVEVQFPVSKSRYRFKDEAKAVDCVERAGNDDRIVKASMFVRPVHDWEPYDAGVQGDLL